MSIQQKNTIRIENKNLTMVMMMIFLAPLPEVIIIVNIKQAMSRVWTCTEMELCSSDNSYIKMIKP